MCAALVLWSALLGLATPRGNSQHSATLLGVAAGAAAVLTTLRSIGPLWVLLIVGTTILLVSVREVGSLVRRVPRVTAVGVAVVAATTVAAVLWTRATDAARLVPYDIEIPNVWTATLEQVPLWLLQGVAAFPRRGDAAPRLVYLLVLIVLMAFFAAGVIFSDRRLRVVLLLAAGLSLAVPFLLTVATIRVSGPIWQGRYGIPFHMGLILMATLALERRSIPRGVAVTLIAVASAALAAAHEISIVHVLRHEAATSPFAGTSVWVSAPGVIIAIFALAGSVGWVLAMLLSGSAPSVQEHEAAEAAAQFVG
jgi:hypothetical protein